MKQFVLLSILALFLERANAQFVTKPLNFPSDNYYPFFIRPVDTNTVWVGADYVNGAYYAYSNAIKSTDGGNTWQFYPIPDTGNVIIFDVAALDANTCYYVFWNGKTGIWKTADGGSTWVNTTTNTFTGGFANFYHAFSAQEGLAGGDPNNGYWEIELTHDGGNIWSRVPSANIPAPADTEYGISAGYSAIGNHIWFVSNKGRCYRSVNGGNNWTVTDLPGKWVQPRACFTDSLRGVIWERAPYFKKSSVTLPYNTYFMTNDGGLSWTQKSLPQNYAIQSFSRVPGVDGGMIVAAYDSSQHDYTTVLFTSDFFTTTRVVQTGLSSEGESTFLSSKSGWLSGRNRQNDNIYKFTGDLMAGTSGPYGDKEQFQVYPNPSSSEAILKLPGFVNGSACTVKVLDIIGKELDRIIVTSVSPYIQLNASNYPDGIYLIQLIRNDATSAVCRWLVFH